MFVEVKVLVRVDSNGRWAAEGWDYSSDQEASWEEAPDVQELRDMLNESDVNPKDSTEYWLRAQLGVPSPLIPTVIPYVDELEPEG